MAEVISGEIYRLLVEEALVGVYSSVQDGRLIYGNRKLAELFGYSRDEMTALSSVLVLIAPEFRDVVRESMRQRLAGEVDVTEYTVLGQTKDGRTLQLDVRSVRAEHNGRPAVLGTMVDITDRKQLEETLRTLALIDDLTGLYNRRGFVTLATVKPRLARRKHQSLILIAADVDDLKVINDRFGHAVGDQALVAAAGVLEQTYREADIIARLGGDEFTVFPIEASSSAAPLLLERLNANLRKWNEVHQREFYLSMSTGAAILEGELSKDVTAAVGGRQPALSTEAKPRAGGADHFAQSPLLGRGQ